MAIRLEAAPDRDTYVTDTEAKRGQWYRDEKVEVTFTLERDTSPNVVIGWSWVKPVEVHPELLVETLRQLGYRVEKP